MMAVHCQLHDGCALSAAAAAAAACIARSTESQRPLCGSFLTRAGQANCLELDARDTRAVVMRRPPQTLGSKVSL